MGKPSWEIPPTSTPEVAADINAMANVFKNNVSSIPLAMHKKACAAAGITPKISLENLTKWINAVCIPQMQKFEGGWDDHPNDSGGPTMRGVILICFWENFDTIFTNSGVPAVSAAAKAFNKKYPGWKKDKELGKQVLYLVNQDPIVAGLFYHEVAASASARYPIAIMTEDPYLGHLMVEGVWGTGQGIYLPKYANIGGCAKEFGWDGNTSSWAKHACSLGDRTPEYAMKYIVYRYAHLDRISRPGNKNNVFRKGWFNRLYVQPDSNLSYSVITTENFLLNKKGLFKFSAAEQAHVARKAAVYKTLSITLPG